jgi:hypothetical protein
MLEAALRGSNQTEASLLKKLGSKDEETLVSEMMKQAHKFEAGGQRGDAGDGAFANPARDSEGGDEDSTSGADRSISFAAYQRMLFAIKEATRTSTETTS